MDKIRMFWPFRNLANFSLTVIGISGFGLLYNSIRNEKVFSRSPVIIEGIKVLSSSETIKSLLGLPIQYNATFNNTYNINENDQYYHFQVKGPKSATTAELSSLKMKVSQINKIIDHSLALSNQLNQKQQQYQQMLQQNKRIKKKQQKAKATELANTFSLQLIKLRLQAQAAQIKRIQIMKKFYIPDEELYQKVIRSKSPSQIVSEDQYLYAIEALSANLPNRNVIDILSQNKSRETERPPQSRQKYLVPKITEGYLGERLKQNRKKISQNQLESYGKHKTNLMYGKYGGYRVGFMIIFMIAGFSLAMYFHKLRFKPIGGTIIARQVDYFLFNNAKFKKILNEKQNKKGIKLSNFYQGGRYGNSFNSSVNIQGINGAKIYFQGNISKNDKVVFKKFVYQEPNGRKVDLIV